MYNEITCKVKSRLSSAGYIRSKILQAGRLYIAACFCDKSMVTIGWN